MQDSRVGVGLDNNEKRFFFFFFGWSDVYGLIDRPYIHEIKKKKCISSLRKMPALPCSAFNVLVSLQ